MPNPLVVTNAQIANEDQLLNGDVMVRNGRIDKIGSQLPVPENAVVIDAEGRFLLPGMIDDQVHFREPGLTHKGDLASESKAAVAGGITSFMEMPNTQPQTVSLDELERKFERAQGRCAANYSFYLGATNDNLEQIKALDPNQACGIKVFMGSSTGNMLVDNINVLNDIFANAPGIITTHCESSPLIAAELQRAKRRYGGKIPLQAHPEIRSREACIASSELAISLARRHRSQLHILHISTAEETELLDSGPLRDKHITGEVCVHFLHFSDRDYAKLGNRIKCNPAIKRERDRQALIDALADGRLDIIATDHAPHTWEEKQSDDYLSAPAGLPLVQHALVGALELVSQQRLTLAQVVRNTAHNVADRFQVRDRGYIREGYWADLVLLERGNRQPVSRDEVLYRCGWSPFEGYRFDWRVDTTLVNGRIVYRNGELQKLNAGCRLAFDR